MSPISIDILKHRSLKNGQQEAFYSYKQLFKSGQFDASDLAKTASAMANAIGGYIYMGLNISKGRFIGWEQPQYDLPELDSFKQLINHALQPSIDALAVHAFGEGIYIYVPESKSKPHMFSNYKYYKRLLSKNVLMEEFEIRQLYQSSQKSDLQIISMTNMQGIPNMSSGLFDSMKFYPRIHIQNLGQRIENFYKLEMALPSALVDESFTVLHKYLKGYEQDKNIYSIPGTEPLFQSEIKTMVELVLKVNSENFKQFLGSEIVLKLFSSEKVHEQVFLCREWFHYKGSLPQIESFVKKIEE